jgi:hypothetical protein
MVTGFVINKMLYVFFRYWIKFCRYCNFTQKVAIAFIVQFIHFPWNAIFLSAK